MSSTNRKVGGLLPGRTSSLLFKVSLGEIMKPGVSISVSVNVRQGKRKALGRICV